MGRSRTKFQARNLALLAAALAILVAGCVERRVLVRTNPPLAALYVDDNYVGLTPIPFTPIYYGTRKIRLVKDGYETKTVLQSIPPPWYEIPPLDFFAENVIPGTLNDMRTLDFQLTPQAVVPKEDLLGRAEGLRRGTQSVSGLAAPGYRVNPPAPVYSPPPGAPGGPPVGGQPYYPLPPGTTIPSAPQQPLYAPGAGPFAPQTGPNYQPAPSYQPAPGLAPGASLAPSNVGSQPYFPLPSGQ